MPAMLRSSVLIVALLIAHAYAAPPPDMPCLWSSPNGTSFDLSELKAFASTENPAMVGDRLINSKSEYFYTFGICQPIAPPKGCVEADGSTPKTEKHAWAPAWQQQKDKNDCFYVGTTDQIGTNPWWEDEHTEWSLLSEVDPSEGVSLTMRGGQACMQGQHRTLKMNFKCVKKGVDSLERHVVDEKEHCQYEINIDSQFACPTECGFGASRGACGGNGVCGYDTQQKRSRCFCNEGFTGGGCGATVTEDKEQQDYGPILGLLVVVVIALAGFGAAGYFLFRWLQTRTLRIGDDSYSKLEAQYGDSMVADDGDAPPRMGISTGPSNI